MLGYLAWSARQSTACFTKAIVSGRFGKLVIIVRALGHNLRDGIEERLIALHAQRLGFLVGDREGGSSD
jgi:hypothetical protein